jgi:hypothetical protein
MRTTVDILDSLDQQLRERAARLGISFKEALNRVIAAGLPQLEPPAKKFKVRARDLGWKPGIDIHHLNRLADELDDEERWGRC